MTDRAQGAPRIAIAIHDFLLSDRVRRTAAAAKVALIDITDATELERVESDAVGLILVEMTGVEDERWQEIVRVARRRMPQTRCIAFGPHVDEAARQRARELGAIEVWSRRRFSERLPHLIAEAASSATGCQDEMAERLAEGIRLFNAGEYFECHEVLEAAWFAEPRPCRRLYQAILQLAVALYQVESGNRAGAQKMFQRCLPKLAEIPSPCQSVDVQQLLALARTLRDQLEREGLDGLAARLRRERPHIPLAASDGPG